MLNLIPHECTPNKKQFSRPQFRATFNGENNLLMSACSYLILDEFQANAAYQLRSITEAVLFCYVVPANARYQRWNTLHNYPDLHV